MILPLGPSWRSSKSIPKRCRTTATSASHFLEDVPGEIDISENPKVSPAISISQSSEDVSGETLIFGIRSLEAAFSASHLFEDVSGASPIFEDPKISTADQDECSRRHRHRSRVDYSSTAREHGKPARQQQNTKSNTLSLLPLQLPTDEPGSGCLPFFCIFDFGLGKTATQSSKS